jgi:hypothetical protein
MCVRRTCIYFEFFIVSKIPKELLFLETANLRPRGGQNAKWLFIKTIVEMSMTHDNYLGIKIL